jgi:hypothetical protein
MHKLLVGQRVSDEAPRILCDSQSALALVLNPVVSQQSKQMLYHRAGRNEILLEYCST